MRTLIKNGRVITPEATFAGYVLVEDGVINTIGKGDYDGAADEVIDAEGRYISPGFIDIHTHGA